MGFGIMVGKQGVSRLAIRIFVVDDHEPAREFVSEYLSREQEERLCAQIERQAKG